MKQLLIIPTQSISDIITNSSSEVFILNTNKTCEEVNNILNEFTCGFEYPEIFHLNEFREWRKNIQNDDEYSYPRTIFDIAKNWFKDPENEEDLLEHHLDFLFYPYESVPLGNTDIYVKEFKSYPIYESFIEYINENLEKLNHIIDLNKSDKLEDYKYELKYNDIFRDLTKKFLKEYKGELPPSKYWNIPYREDVTNLDGCVLVVSSDDNSIPYDTWDKIREIFNGWNVHLG